LWLPDGCGVEHARRRPFRDGAIALGTGIVGWCPAYTLFGISTVKTPAGHCPHCDTVITSDGSMTMARLNASLRTKLRNVLVALPRPVTLLVFVGAACETCGEARELVYVTPTSPYCSRAALPAHKMALVSDWVTADAVDATEFPELADSYHVQGVPRTIVNDTVHIEGAVPEAMLMAELILEDHAPPTP
jgi:thioredoxin family protein/DUF2892 family protein